MTRTSTKLRTIEVSVSSPLSGDTLHLTVSGSRPMEDVLRVAAARFHILDDETGFAGLQLRREDAERAINLAHPAAETIAPGDQLIVEPAVGPGSGGKSVPTEAGQASRFTAVATEAARDSLSRDSATFNQRIRQVTGE